MQFHYILLLFYQLYFFAVYLSLFLMICRTGIKIGAVVAVVKVSNDLDIWSLDSNQGAQKLAAFKETIVPGTIVFPKEVAFINIELHDYLYVVV